jgi:RNA polymerase sigma-70 factor (ECF subfamily)
MARDLVDRIVRGDPTAMAQASVVYAASAPAERTALLDTLARLAATSPPCLDTLLALVDDHRLDRPAIRRVLVDNDQADDAHQDVLIVVAQQIGRFEGRSAFTTWLHSVARNIAVDHLRRRRDTVHYDADTLPGSAAQHLSSLIASRSDLLRAVNALPDSYRHAVVLRDIEQRTYQEIADALGAEMNTVKSRISRGRALVASMMAEKLPAPPAAGPGTGWPPDHHDG